MARKAARDKAKAELKKKARARVEFDREWTQARRGFLALEERRTSHTATQADMEELQRLRQKLARMAAKRPSSYDIPAVAPVRRPTPKSGVRRVVPGGSPGLGKRA